MKTTYIISVLFVTIFCGCGTSNQMAVSEEIEVAEAAFRHWSEAPPVQSDVRERGTDLRLTIRNWPEGAEPGYVVFRKRRSFPAEISDTTDAGIIIRARIVMASAVLAELSKPEDVSDRFVFTDPDGEMRYVEIEEWSRMEE